MNDSIDMVIREWEAQSGCSVSYGELGIAFERDASMVAAWRRAGPEAVLLGYLQTGADAHREADVSELRVALGLPAWVAPPAPPRAVPSTYPNTGSWTAEVAEENAQALKEQVERLLERAEQAEADLAAFRNVHDAACCARNSARERANRTEAALAEAHRAVLAVLIENNWPNTGGDAFASLKAAVDAAREQFAQVASELAEARREMGRRDEVHKAFQYALSVVLIERRALREVERTREDHANAATRLFVATKESLTARAALGLLDEHDKAMCPSYGVELTDGGER